MPNSSHHWSEQTNPAPAHKKAGHCNGPLPSCEHPTEGGPESAETWFRQGLTAWKAGDIHQAEHALAKAVACDGNNPNYFNFFGVLLLESGQSQAAETILARGLSIHPQSTDMHCNLGRALMLQGRFEQAMQSYEKALAIDPNHAVTLSNMAVVHQSCRRLPSAIVCYRRALQIDSNRPEWWSNLGAALLSQARYRPAESCFRTALLLAPNHATATKGLGVACCAQGHYEAAAQVLAKFLKICPHDADANATLAIVYQHTGNWTGFERILPNLARQTAEFLHRNQMPAEQPLFNISRSDDLRLNLAVARAWSGAIAQKARRSARPFDTGNRRSSTSNRISLGYLSADFRNHAMAHQLVSLFELHDRGRFRICGFSVGPDSDDDYRRRISTSCDQFQVIADLDAGSAARVIRDQRVDILIDLMGHTQQNRLDIAALRPAPVQISYLGFPASSGADYIDYLIGDPVVTPDEDAPYYSEKLIRLPHCYQIISPIPAAGGEITRQAVGLPEDAFVFCCFNQVYKIDPAVFDSWMKILKAVPAAVLWLFRSSDQTADRLRNEARRQGVSPERLIFADKVPLNHHLARLRLADAALDTPRYNGGATTANALTANVPVVTILGRHFVSRMSASHLATLGLQDLIAADPAAYEKLAIELALTPSKLAEVRQRLKKGLECSPLLDTAGFVRNLENAFETIWQRHCAGHSPEKIDLAQLVFR